MSSVCEDLDAFKSADYVCNVDILPPPNILDDDYFGDSHGGQLFGDIDTEGLLSATSSSSDILQMDIAQVMMADKKDDLINIHEGIVVSNLVEFQKSVKCQDSVQMPGSVFDEGISADDLSSLLSQFEQASEFTPCSSSENSVDTLLSNITEPLTAESEHVSSAVTVFFSDEIKNEEVIAQDNCGVSLSLTSDIEKSGECDKVSDEKSSGWEHSLSVLKTSVPTYCKQMTTSKSDSALLDTVSAVISTTATWDHDYCQVTKPKPLLQKLAPGVSAGSIHSDDRASPFRVSKMDENSKRSSPDVLAKPGRERYSRFKIKKGGYQGRVAREDSPCLELNSSDKAMLRALLLNDDPLKYYNENAKMDNHKNKSTNGCLGEPNKELVNANQPVNVVSATDNVDNVHAESAVGNFVEVKDVDRTVVPMEIDDVIDMLEAEVSAGEVAVIANPDVSNIDLCTAAADSHHTPSNAPQQKECDGEPDIKCDSSKHNTCSNPSQSSYKTYPKGKRHFPGKFDNRNKETKQSNVYTNNRISPQELNDGSYYDKLPQYMTALSKPIQRQSASLPILTNDSLPERDPSPNRDANLFSKLPAYYSCFTNSTKYDSLSSVDDTRNHKYPDSNDSINNNECDKLTDRAPVVGRQSRSRSRDNSSRFKKSNHGKRRTRCYRSRSRSTSSVSSYSSSSPSRSRSRSRSCDSSYKRPVFRISSSSRSRSRSSSRGRSRYRSRSPLHSRSRSRSPCNENRYRRRSRSSSVSSTTQHRRNRSKPRSYRHSSRHRRSRSSSLSPGGRPRNRFSSEREDWKLKQKYKREEEKSLQIEQRRIVYVGRIANGMSKGQLRRQFEMFGDIEEISVHFREDGDNYGFVTFMYTCDAYAAIEKGRTIKGNEKYDLCFGGRRQFCKVDYADLDGNAEEEEEMAPVVATKKKEVLDFDELLRQATKKIKKSK